MPAKRTTLDVLSASGVKISNELTMHADPPASKLLVMLPGRGYVIEFPLLYYLRKLALGLGYDVLGVRYAFQVAPEHTAFNAKDIDWQGLANDAWQAITQTLQSRNYQQVCIAGKSLGTPLAAMLADRIALPNKRLLLLTPIANATRVVGKIPTLAVVGTADSYYDASAVAADEAHDNLIWRVYEGLGHSLEADGDWQASLQVLVEIMADCAQFLA